MTTLSDLQTRLAADLRDPGNGTFGTTELTNLVNAGFDAVADVYPKEIVSTIGTVAAGVYSYAVSDFRTVYRLDIYNSDGTYRGTAEKGFGEGPNSGWEQHGLVVYLPPSWDWTAGDTIRAFGYGGYIVLSASSSTTDADPRAINAMLVHARWKALAHLASDRALFQQWQTESNNTDVTIAGIIQSAVMAEREWREEQRRLRRMRKLG